MQAHHAEFDAIYSCLKAIRSSGEKSLLIMKDTPDMSVLAECTFLRKAISRRVRETSAEDKTSDRICAKTHKTQSKMSQKSDPSVSWASLGVPWVGLAVPWARLGASKRSIL